MANVWNGIELTTSNHFLGLGFSMATKVRDIFVDFCASRIFRDFLGTFCAPSTVDVPRKHIILSAKTNPTMLIQKQ